MKPLCKVRVIYGDTDAMGIVYYANYYRWFEMGRVELLRKYGVVYRDLTSRGIHLPVLNSSCRYHKPARYDDSLIIYARLSELKRARLAFEYRIESEDSMLISTGHTEHAFTDTSGKPLRPPVDIIQLLKKVNHA